MNTTDQKIDRLEQKFDDNFVHLEQKFDNKFVQLEQKFDNKFVQLEQKFDKFEQKFDKLDQTVNKILVMAIDTQATVGDLKERVTSLEEVNHEMFNKMDDFLVILNRHDVEIVANRAGIQRVEGRVEVLEAKNSS